MADDDNPPLILEYRSTTEILHHTTTIISSTPRHLLTFLALSVILFTLLSNLEQVSYFTITYVDNHHDIESLLSRFQPPPKHTINTTTSLRNRHPRPISHLTPFPILEDDYYLGEDDNIDHRQLNVTSYILDSFDPRAMSFRSVEIIKKENDHTIINNDSVINNAKRVKFEGHEWKTLMRFTFVILFSNLVVILACVGFHIWVHGIVFVVVVNDFLNRQDQNEQAFMSAVCLVSKRLPWLVMLRLGVRFVFSLVLGGWLFREAVGPYLQIRILVRLMFMPFSTASPWVNAFEEDEYFNFKCLWFWFDFLVSFAYYSLHVWVAMADMPRRTRLGVINEGCHLMLLMFPPAIKLKCLEAIGCGWFAKYILTLIFGKLLAYMILCFVEVYFMVAWMMHYVSVKSVDAWLYGEPFGSNELEAMVEDDG